MAVTQQELSDFITFAAERLSNGGVETRQELLDEWNARRAHENSVAAIRESVAQYKAGPGRPVKGAFGAIHERLG